ncbi:MAG: hypothetical protein QG591_2258 [Planctomycetota bacterium]|nr:hypothetical protein [Planctomycetota bacterium]
MKGIETICVSIGSWNAARLDAVLSAELLNLYAQFTFDQETFTRYTRINTMQILYKQI